MTDDDRAWWAAKPHAELVDRCVGFVADAERGKRAELAATNRIRDLTAACVVVRDCLTLDPPDVPLAIEAVAKGLTPDEGRDWPAIIRDGIDGRRMRAGDPRPGRG